MLYKRIYQDTKMMTRSKTIAAAVAAKAMNATDATADVQVIEPVANDDSTVIYPSMFNRWEQSLW
jgi:hypothetical protein